MSIYSKILNNIGCKYFYVATIEEGIELRKLLFNVNIYVLNGLRKNQIKLFYQYNLIPVINNLKEYNIIKKHNRIKKINIHFDTGINRLGIDAKKIKNYHFRNLKIQLILSHLASANEYNNSYNVQQKNNFINSYNFFQDVKYKSIANSAGIALGKKYHLDMVRKNHKVSNISSEAIFSVRSTDPSRFLISIVFCLSLIFVDLRFNTSNYIRGYIQDLYSPLFFLIELPKTVLNNTSLVFSSREKL